LKKFVCSLAHLCTRGTRTLPPFENHCAGESLHGSVVASPKFGGGAKNFGGKMFDFRRITPFCLEKRHSKGKMTIFSKNLGGYGPFCPSPGYAYASGVKRSGFLTSFFLKNG